MLDEVIELCPERLPLVAPYSSRAMTGSPQRTVAASTGVPGLDCGIHKFSDWRAAFQSDLGELGERHQRDELVEISSIQRNDCEVWFH